MKVYVCNALSMGMLDRDVQSLPVGSNGEPRIPRPLTLAQARDIVRPELNGQPLPVEIVAAVGHADTARLIADAINLPFEQVNGRITVRLSGQPAGAWGSVECALIGAYTGPRLPEGCTTLPAGASLEWWIV